MTATAEKIKIMQAHEDGQRIESKSCYITFWEEDRNPTWNWHNVEYRIAPPTPDKIDWRAIAPEYGWVARQQDNHAFLFKSKPELYGWGWGIDSNDPTCVIPAIGFASYRNNGLPWRESLIERPATTGGD